MRVSGDPDHPYTRGTLCPKMTRYQDTVHSPRRLTIPLLRTGAKGAGEFRPIDWDEAVDRIAGRWRQIIAGAGTEAILPYSYAGTMGLIQRNAGHPFFYRLGASRLERTICTPAKEVGWKAVMGETPAPHPDEVADSDLVILWGINAAATNFHFLRGVRQAQKSGAQVWLIDTYRTETAAVADRTFLVRPGHDGALALGLMHLLVRERLLDRPFLETSVQGFAELEKQILPDYPPKRVSELTGLAESTLLEMARAYGRARAPFIRIGGGLCRYGNSAMTVRSIVALPALVGAWNTPGGGCFCGTSTSGAFAMNEVLREDFLARPTRSVNMNQLGDALNELHDPPVQSLYVYNSNPAAVAPDQNRVLQGLARDDLFTVVHERFLTDTARYADIVLPATSSLEHSDLYRSYGTYCIQRAQPVIPPVGSSKSNWEVFALLAEAMGFGEPFFRQGADDPHRPAPVDSEADARRARPGGAGRGPGGRIAHAAGATCLCHPFGENRAAQPGSTPVTPGLYPALRRRTVVEPDDGALSLRPQLHFLRAGRSAPEATGDVPEDESRGRLCPRSDRRQAGDCRKRAWRGPFCPSSQRAGARRSGGGRGGLVAGIRTGEAFGQRSHFSAAHRPGGRQHFLRQPGRGVQGMTTGFSLLSTSLRSGEC